VRRRLVALALVFAATVAVTYAQQIWRGGYGYTPPRFPTKDSFQGTFNFCRLMFTSNRREKRGWDTDYPGADINFSVRIAELTKTRVAMPPAGGDPEHVVVRLTDDWLFQCPWLLMEDGGTVFLTDVEAKRFGEYLRKGGFVFASDTWGEYAQRQFEEQMGRVLPSRTYPMVDLPLDSAIWKMQFVLKQFPQMPSIQSWRRSGGSTERGTNEPPVVRGISDENGRLMVVMYHNADIPDGWEREGEEPEYFYRFSPDAYSVGVNVLLYAMSH
jgi:hypothetical protein